MYNMRQTDILLNNLEYTESDLSSLEAKVTKVQDLVINSVDTLNVFKTINTDLKTLDDTIKLVSTVLTTFTTLPVVGGGVSITKKSLDTIDSLVHPIRDLSDKAEKAILPVRDTLKKVQTKIKSLQDEIIKSSAYTTDIYNSINTVNVCAIDNQSSTIIDLLDEFSTSLNRPVALLNKSLYTCKVASSVIETKIQKLDDSMYCAIKVSKEINNVMVILNNIKHSLYPINGALNKKISVSYGVKVKVPETKKKWYKVVSFWTWKTETQNFSFTVKQIIDGINTGISFVQDQLMKGAENALKEIGVKIPTMPNIPYLNDLEKELNIAIDIHTVVDDLECMYDDLRTIMDSLNTLKVSLDHFNIKC